MTNSGQIRSVFLKLQALKHWPGSVQTDFEDSRLDVQSVGVNWSPLILRQTRSLAEWLYRDVKQS